jgi:hypothetical protein
MALLCSGQHSELPMPSQCIQKESLAYMQGYSTGLLKRIPNTKRPTSFAQPAFLANVHKGEPPRDVMPQDHGSGTCEIEFFCVVLRRKNHLDILEGHFSNKEMKATDKLIPAGRGQRRNLVFSPLKQTNYDHVLTKSTERWSINFNWSDCDN